MDFSRSAYTPQRPRVKASRMNTRELATPSLRDTIRHRTRDAHEALEATGLMRDFAQGSISAAQYGIYLRLQQRLHATLESGLSRWFAPDIAAVRLCKSEWLTEDLLALGTLPDTAVGETRTIPSSAAAIGTMYVLEGGTLGLQVVRRRLHDAHPALQGAGRFLLGYGSDTGRRWREFVAWLDALPPAEWPAALAAAEATFLLFHAAFAD